jgi:4-diphosphocytidyl-2-C-methyl-D-erythritol kinase
VLATIDATAQVLLTRMSGSGATCFGLYANLADAQLAAFHIRNALASSHFWVEADEIN